MMNILEDPFYEKHPNTSNIDQYPTIIDIMEALAEEEEKSIETFDPLVRTMMSNMIRLGLYYLVAKESGSNEACLLPAGKRLFTLFRGQSKYYKDCKPSLYRQPSEENLLLSHLQYTEFKMLLDSHPVINDLAYNPICYPQISTPIKLLISYEGLAQHYGISTNLLDFTNNKWIAAFFATTFYDEHKKTYFSINKEIEPYGVFYIYDEDLNHDIQPLGLHYFNRPGAQSGFALSLSENDNLNELQNIKKIFFRHDNESSRTVFSMTQKGKLLFPEDNLVNKVDALLSNRSFSLTSVVRCKSLFYPHISYSEFQNLLKTYHIETPVNPLVSFLNDPYVQEEWHIWQKEGKKRYLDSIQVLPVYKM